MTLEENSSQETSTPDLTNDEGSVDNQEQTLEAQLESTLEATDENSTGQATETEDQPAEQLPEEGATTDEDVIDWTKDGRYKERWGEDPNNLYKSYKSLETKLQEDGEHRNQLTGELTQAQETLKQYDEVVQYLDLIGQNPEYNNRLQSTLKEINQDMRRKQYGADLPDHVLAKLDEVDSVKSELAQIKEERVINEHTQIIDEGLKEIDKVAKEHGIEYSAEDFLKHCSENNVPPSLINDVFISQNIGTILSKQKSQTQEKVLKNVTSNTVGSMPVSSRTPSPSKSEGSSFGDLRAKLRETLGIKN